MVAMCIMTMMAGHDAKSRRDFPSFTLMLSIVSCLA